MAEMELLPNSHKYKQEQKELAEKKRVAPVVKGGAKIKKKSEISKLSDVFISEDVGKVKSYVWMDVVVPAAKKLITDIVVGGLDMIFYGETGRSTKRATTDRFSYSSCYNESRSNRPSESRNRFEYDDIVFPSRSDAARVQEELANVIDRYGFVTVLDLYDMAELTAPHTANKYGWMSKQSIIHADIIRGREGYIIKLPKAMPID